MPQKVLTPVAAALKKLRTEKLEANQSDLAKLLGVSLSTVAKWETGQVTPSPMACKALSKLDREHSTWWIEQAGEFYANVDNIVSSQKRRYSHAQDDMLIVPMLTSVIAAGQPAVVETTRDEYEGSVAIPIPKGGETGAFVAARVRGASMEPRVADGSIVVIDTRRWKAEENIGCIVAARNDEGITVKKLLREKGNYFLVAENPAFEPHLQQIDAENSWSIAGRVVCWITEPSSPVSAKRK